jgi:hypothetical protein
MPMAITHQSSTKSVKPSTVVGMGCLVLFALPFAAIGLMMAMVVAAELWTWQSAQRWVETPATLLAADLEENHDGDGVTYRVTATYSYEYGGEAFTNARVGLHQGSDNSRYHQDRAQELEEIEKSGGKLSCYVNPRDPAQAMLFRELRVGPLLFELMFAVIFGGVGFGLIAAAIWGAGKVKRQEQLKQALPDAPWQWRDDWASGRIRSSEGATAWVLSIFAIIWNAFCWPIFWMVWNDQRAGGPPILLAALFPAAGAFIGVWAIYLWLRRLRWGVSEFEMAAVPGVLGGPLAGVIHAPGGVRPDEGFVLRLACQKTTRRTSGGDSSSETQTLWENETRIFRDLATSEGNRTLIPVKLLVPFDLPSSGEDVKWLLEAKAETVGVDYFASFEVPVFKTPASSARIDGETSAAESIADDEPTDLATAAARLGGVLEPGMPDARSIYFPAARNRGMAAFLAMFSLAWFGICCGLFVGGAPRVIPAAMGLVGVLPLYAAISACFGSVRLEYNPRSVAYTRRVLGLGRRRELPRSQISVINVDRSGTTYNGRAYRKIVASTVEPRDVTLLNEIGGFRDAERLAADMRQVLELTESRNDGSASRINLEAELPSDFRGR